MLIYSFIAYCDCTLPLFPYWRNSYLKFILLQIYLELKGVNQAWIPPMNMKIYWEMKTSLNQKKWMLITMLLTQGRNGGTNSTCTNCSSLSINNNFPIFGYRGELFLGWVSLLAMTCWSRLYLSLSDLALCQKNVYLDFNLMQICITSTEWPDILDILRVCTLVNHIPTFTSVGRPLWNLC